jgi:hypothetical protein
MSGVETDEVRGPGGSSTGDISGVMRKDDWQVIFAGATPHAFKIMLFGRIQRTAQIEIHVDGSIASTLTDKATASYVEGNSIRLHSRGSEPQAFMAYAQ